MNDKRTTWEHSREADTSNYVTTDADVDLDSAMEVKMDDLLMKIV